MLEIIHANPANIEGCFVDSLDLNEGHFLKCPGSWIVTMNYTMNAIRNRILLSQSKRENRGNVKCATTYSNSDQVKSAKSNLSQHNCYYELT